MGRHGGIVGRDYETESGESNKVLELPGEDLDESTRTAL